MRTTIELPDQVFRMAKHVAAERGMTLRELVTQSLEHELAGRSSTGRARLPLPVVRVPADAPILRMTDQEVASLAATDDLRGLNDIYRRR